MAVLHEDSDTSLLGPHYDVVFIDYQLSVSLQITDQHQYHTSLGNAMFTHTNKDLPKIAKVDRFGLDISPIKSATTSKKR